MLLCGASTGGDESAVSAVISELSTVGIFLLNENSMKESIPDKKSNASFPEVY